MRIEMAIASFLLLVVLLVYRMFTNLCATQKDEMQNSECGSVVPLEEEPTMLEEIQLPGSKR